ncbi:MAG: HAD family hydrolase [Deltaproteobacteria bacterium]|nr:HAD family hydrolase [Deltaproteobacteria bacterium]
MVYRGVLFDLDGTLLDTLEDLAGAVNRLLAERGYPTHSVDSYRYFVGNGPLMLITRALPETARQQEIISACLEAFRADYRKTWQVHTRLYPGVAEMLDGLSSRRLQLAILSNKPHDFTLTCVDKMLNQWNFSVVLGLRDSVPAKPDPAGALEVSHAVGIPPEEFLYLGDTSVDMKTAVAAGMHPVGVLWGFRSPEELQQSGARMLLERPQEIFQLLG